MTDWPHKLDHVGIHVSDLATAVRFYQAALAPIGIELLGSSESHAAFGSGPMPYLTIRVGARVGAPVHLAFVAAAREEVDAFHQAALASGGRDNGAPGLRRDYHPEYYGAFVLDPDGHNIEVVKHVAE